MNTQDARKLSEDSLELLRRQAHRLRHAGHTWVAISAAIGVHLTTVKKWARKFDFSVEELTHAESDKRGRRFGEKRTLSMANEYWLKDQIVGSSPSQLSLPFALWSRKAVHDVILMKFGVDMPIRTVGEYLRRWEFTPQRPAKRAAEQRPQAVKQWLEADYPAIVRRAKAEGGEVHWADETAIKQDTAWVRGYAPVGQTPVLEHRARWESITMISALTNQGQLRFAFYDGAINKDRFIEFMGALIQDAPSKVFLVVDNLRVHHAIKVREWLAPRREKIEIFYLPPYSPEVNPDEHLNRDLKTELRMRPSAKDAASLKSIAVAFMESVALTPQRIVRYFKSRHIAYAAG